MFVLRECVACVVLLLMLAAPVAALLLLACGTWYLLRPPCRILIRGLRARIHRTPPLHPMVRLEQTAPAQHGKVEPSPGVFLGDEELA